MTSKKALEDLYNFVLDEISGCESENKFYHKYNVVKKDLDVLEIFKKKEILQHAVKTATSVNHYNFFASASGYDKLTEKQFKKLIKFYEVENE